MVLRRCAKLGYAEQSATVVDMFLEADDVLFRKILYTPKHTFYTHTYLRGQNFCTRRALDLTTSPFIWKTSDLNERNFLIRVIYKDCY